VAGVALLVLACLVGSSPQVPAPEVVTPSPGPQPGAPTIGAEGPATTPEPDGPDTTSSPPSASELVDPWASVPLQTVVPMPPVVHPPPAPPVAPPAATGAPLLDPWGGTARRHVPRQLDPELRNPFHGLRARHDGPHLARADLRDPFAREGSCGGRACSDASRRPRPAPAPSERAAPAPAPARPPGMPLHPDLRDPFGRRKPGPTPPPTGGAPVAPAPTPDGSDPAPRSGAALPAPPPFAHLRGAQRLA
jgi:hypothetical protein